MYKISKLFSCLSKFVLLKQLYERFSQVSTNGIILKHPNFVQAIDTFYSQRPVLNLAYPRIMHTISLWKFGPIKVIEVARKKLKEKNTHVGQICVLLDAWASFRSKSMAVRSFILEVNSE